MRGALLALMTIAAIAAAQTREDYDAAAALALSARPPVAVERVRPLTWPEASDLMRRHPGQPVLVRVGCLDCSTLCDRVRPELPTCHAEGWTDDTPRMLVLVRDPAGTLYEVQRWDRLPTEREVKVAADAARKWAAPAPLPALVHPMNAAHAPVAPRPAPLDWSRAAWLPGPPTMPSATRFVAPATRYVAPPVCLT